MSGDHLTPEQRKFFAAANAKIKANAPKSPPPAPPAVYLERGDEVELGVRLVSMLGNPEDLAYAESRLWQYRDGAWHGWQDAELERKAQEFAGLPVKYVQNGEDKFRALSLSAKGVKGTVHNANVRCFRADFFTNAPHGAPFRSLFARIDGTTMLIERLSRDHRVRASSQPAWDLPNYSDPDNPPPRPEVVDRLLQQTWAGCPDIDTRIQYFWEWLGAALCGIATRYKDTPMLVGVKDTGKSQILRVVSSVFPASSHRSITLHAMSSDYHRAHLSGGRINFVNELPARELMDGEAAKAILSGDTVNCRLPAGVPFDWQPRCAHIFAANELPPSRDAALMERFVVLDCRNVVPREMQDKMLGDKINAEAPLIAYAALSAVQVLMERGHMVRPASSDDMGRQWAVESNPVALWAQEAIAPSADITTPASDLYEMFRTWATANGHASISSTKFSSRMSGLGYVKVKSSSMRWQVELLTPAQREAAHRWNWNGTGASHD